MFEIDESFLRIRSRPWVRDLGAGLKSTYSLLLLRELQFRENGRLRWSACSSSQMFGRSETFV